MGISRCFVLHVRRAGAYTIYTQLLIILESVLLNKMTKVLENERK
jgi:hypothetical protein